MNYGLVDKELWCRCCICGVRVFDLESFKGKGVGCYYSERFVDHLQREHQKTLASYFSDNLQQDIPLCSCGCGNKAPIVCSGKNVVIKRYIRWHSTKNEPSFLAAVEKMKTDRVGSGNPMYGAKPWNKGETKETNSSVRMVSDKLKGTKMSDASRRKISDSWNHDFNSRHSTPHSEETKEKCRQATLNNIKKGMYSQLKSKPHLSFALILDELGLQYEEERAVGCFSFDFYIPHLDVYVEVDGDYFHSNPLFYADGPKTATQKINYYRDMKKNSLSRDVGIRLIRFWENDIIRNRSMVVDRMKELIDEARENSQH